LSLYITTSRKPSQLTRKLVRWLAIIFGGETENRGKRSIQEAAARAAEKGYSRVLFIYETHGNPSRLVFFDEDGGWLEPEVLISRMDLPETKSPRVPGRVKAVALDKAGEKIVALFCPEEREQETKDVVEFKASANKIVFERDGQTVGPRLRIHLAAPQERGAGGNAGETAGAAGARESKES